MKIKRNQVIIAVVVAIVGFLLVNRFMQKPKAAPAAPAALVVAAELKDMKYQILNSSKTEMYRSGDSTAHTIAGTILEQAIDIIVAVLEQPQVVEVGNSIIASKEDADNVATMIEEVGKDVASAIKDTPADKFDRDGVKNAYTTLQSSLKDEVDKTDIWFPIAQRYAEANGSKAPFNMDDNQKNKVKNASPSEKEQARDAMKEFIDADFGRSGGGTVDQRKGVGGDRPKMAGSMDRCLNTRKRGEKGWISHGRKAYTEAEARALCAGKKYMSLECPTKDGYEVWCANDITDMPVLDDAECMGNTTTKSVPGHPTNGGCDAGGGKYVTSEGLNMGGAHRGSLYVI